MKTKTFTVALVAYAFFAQAQLITRGTEPGEIYLSRNWYLNAQNQMVSAVFRSIDNGQNLSLQYSSTEMPEQSTRLDIVSGASPGVLYGTNAYKLYISHDYAKTWQFVENTRLDGRYVSGVIIGQVYKTWTNEPLNRQELLLSVDFGANFYLLNDGFDGRLEIGTENNELYTLHGIYHLHEKYKLFHSNNAGLDFNLQIEIDTSVGGYSISGQNTIISRGAVAGELYLVSWHTPAHYKIYYSNDYGQTFEFKYQSEYCNLYWWGFHFTAGREPGSFYVMRNTGTDSPYFHAQIYIDYSSDYGETFTTYFHDLDSSYVFADINLLEGHNNITVFPNPFSQNVTLSLPPTVHYGTVIILNSIGQIVFQTKYQSQEPTLNLSHLPTGIYFYKIHSKDHRSFSGKVVKY